MSKLKKIFSSISTAIDIALIPFWVVFVTLLISQIIARYVLGVPLVWAEEVARISLIWLTFIGAARVALIDDHIDIPVISSRATGVFKRFLVFLKVLCVLMTSFMLVYGAWKLLEFSSSATSSGAGLSLAWWYWPAIFGGCGLFFSVFVILFPKANYNK